MKGAKLQAAYARRRDAEQMKLEKTKDVDKYFDRWNKITSRFEQWTTPEYYKLADTNLKISEERKQKNLILEQRREKLRKLLDAEKAEFAREIKELRQPTNRRVISNEILKGIHETYKRTEEESRRLTLESQLYKKWRYGFCEDSILLDAKTDNEAMAKMNWMDKQIAMQVEKEKMEKQREMDRIRALEEMRLDDERLHSRKLQRDEEVNELKRFQEQQLEELKNREKETETLHQNERELRECEKRLSAELTKLDIHVNQQIERIQCPHNLRRIKMLLKKLSDTIRKDLCFDIELLDRLSSYWHTNNQQISMVREQFQMQCDLEVQRQAQIEAMYESEAKITLLKQQEIWLKESHVRETQLRSLIADQLQQISSEIAFIVNRQKELCELRESHRKAIDNANDRIKSLLNAYILDDEKQRLTDAERQQMAATIFVTDASTIAKSYHLPGQFEQTLSIGDNSARSSGSGGGAPRFGRKKIAWT